jgi:hypothetical protein
MFTEKITELLSNHRYSDNRTLPQPLTKHQIISLLTDSVSPNESQENLNDEIQKALNELQAEGEVVAGKRNYYCIAPPTVLAKNQEDVAELLFRGDRAYLSLAHQVLDSSLNPQKPRLRPKIKNLKNIKKRLAQVGIVVLTLSESIEPLPKPRNPLKSELRSPRSDDPFSIQSWQNQGEIKRYLPYDRGEPQKERWRIPLRNDLKNEDILSLPTGEYVWFENQKFYELEPDIAILAMFYQDKQMGYSLKNLWDEPSGKLNLQGVVLPSTYARLLWHLSEPGEEYRTRKFQSKYWSLVKEIFERLGVKLV